ncbi:MULTISPECIES: hypothetical protein [unclassified Microcoleus]|uniref:hypothetical protein n=1 Tax=unclassified Microcoleus TaxID=2642155 RepID=UPI002FD36219
MADTPNTCEVSPTSSLSEVFRQDDLEKGSNNLKYYFEHESAWGGKLHQCQLQARCVFHKNSIFLWAVASSPPVTATPACSTKI